MGNQIQDLRAAHEALEQEIGERKRAEGRLHQSEDRYRALILASSQALYRMSPDWSEMRQLRGGAFIADAEKPNRDWLQEYILPEDQQQVLEKIRESMETGTVFELEHRVRRVDGTIGWTFSRAVPVRNAAGEIVEWFGAASDITERKLAEEQLRASEEKYRTLFTNMSEGFALGEPILDDQGRPVDYRYLEVNEAFYKQTGIPRDIRGRPLREVLPHLEQTWIDLYCTVALTGQSECIESYNADTQRHYDVHCFCPSPGRFAILFRDITEQKRTQDALQDSKQSLALALRAGGSAAWELNVATGRMIPVDEMLYTMVGYAPEELAQPADWISRIHKDDQPAVTRNLTDVIEGKRDTYWQELRLRRKDGKWQWLLSLGVAVERDAEGRATRLIGTNTDIDARKRTEERLKESEEKYRALFTNMADGFGLGEPIFDSAGKIIDLQFLEVNEAFYVHTGMPRGITERPLREHLPQIEQQWIDRQGAVAVTGRVDNLDMYNADTDRYYDLHAFSPSPGRFAVLFRDVTDRKRAERQREHLNVELERRVEERTAELKAANRELEGFTFATSHDLKGPLGRINSFSTLLEREYRDRLEGDGLLFLGIIRQNAIRLTRLVEDLLSYAQIAQQRVELQKIDVPATMQAIVQEKTSDLQENRAEIQMDLPPIKVLADPLAFHQALGNLVENALKYSSKAGSPRIEIGGELRENRVRLWVRDNGIGFKMQYHDRIFEIFKRLHTHAEYTGSGVGLALVKRAMERMGGKVWAESTPGQGATFFLELQAAI